MIRRTLLLALLALPLLGGEVPANDTGKSSLGATLLLVGIFFRLFAELIYDVAGVIYEVTADAISHGLKRCGICWRETKKKADTSGWMRGK